MSEEETTQTPFELPEFEGQIPIGVLTNITGSGQRITRPLHNDSSVVLLVEATVTAVNHKNVKGGLKRIQTLSVKDLYEVEGKEGVKMLSAMRLRSKRVEDERRGTPAIPGIDSPKTDHGLTLDTNGVALTPEEAAAAKGEDLTLEDSPDPIVLIFSDKSRALWPDDYEITDSEPFAGDFVRNPNNEDKTATLQVVETQNAFTGEVEETWTPEMEAERLREEEARLAAEEAKPKKKAAKKAPKVIVDEITNAEPEIESVSQSGVGETSEEIV